MSGVAFTTNDLQPYIQVKKEKDMLKKYFEEKLNTSERVHVIFMFGPPGNGKTLLAKNLAKDFSLPYNVVNCVSSMVDLDLLGTYVLKKQEMIWADGPLPEIIRATNKHRAGICICNEINALTPNAQLAFNPLFDHQGEVRLSTKDGEIVKVDEGAHLFVICTMNRDVRGINALQEAFIDRADIAIDMDYPDLNAEVRIISEITKLPESKIKRFVEIGVECRKAAIVDRSVRIALSPRGIVGWINLTKIFGAEEAFEKAVANKYAQTSDEKAVLLTIARGADVSSLSL